jgi:uncharacterized protein with predicted RNA binding PUA domain
LDSKEKFAMSLDYIFGKNVSKALPLERLEFTYSKKTGRIRTVTINEKLLATIRSDGSIALTIYGATLLLQQPEFQENCIVVQEGPDKFVSEGKSLFAKHIVKCGDRIRPESDVAILNVKGEVIAVGKAILSAKMMRRFQVGVAVKVRKSIGKQEEEEEDEIEDEDGQAIKANT